MGRTQANRCRVELEPGRWALGDRPDEPRVLAGAQPDDFVRPLDHVGSGEPGRAR